MRTKALHAVEVKDADKGLVDVVFSKLDVVDRDGDITVDGAFEDGAPVRVSAYGHASWGPSRGSSFVPIPPVGRGMIKVVGDEAVAETKFFLSTTAGRDTFELVKEMDELQEWSYGYDVLQVGKPSPEQKRAGAKQILERLKVHEISPVLLGAGIGTRTIGVKGAKQLDSDLRAALEGAGREKFGSTDGSVWADDFDLDESWAVFSVYEKDGDTRHVRVSFSRGDDGSVELADDATEVEISKTYQPRKGRTFPDEAEDVLGAVRSLVSRVEGWGPGAGAKESPALSTANRERLSELLAALDASTKSLQVLLAESEPGRDRAELERELMAFERLRASTHIGGVTC